MYTWKYFIALVVLIAVANLAAHGHALWDGLFLDDHWHVLRLAESDWSLSAFFNATTIVPDRFMKAWWQEESVSWWYIRPFAMFVSKVVYHLSGGSVKALHAIGIILHGLNALMVHHLVLRMTRRRFWAVVAALLLVVYSHSVYAVAWLAAQNALLQTTLALAALLLYVRASGLDLYAGPRDPSSGSPDLLPREIPRLSIPAIVGFFICWALGLLSRESAVVLPVFVASFDLAFGGWHHVRARLKVYAIMGAVAVAFVLWRLVFFDHPMPDFYVRRPDGPEYVLWWLSKFLHYFTAVVWLSPMTIGPSGRYNPFREVPADIVLMLIILVVMGIGYHMSTRRIKGFWIWPLWIVLGLLPVVPILATPHNGYLPSIGFAIGMAIGPALRDKTRPTSVGRWCTGVAIWFLIATTTYMPIYRPMWYSVMAAERMTIDQVMRMPPLPPARELFFINVPFVNIYARYHLDEAMGRPAQLGIPRQPEPTYRTHVLTYAPDLLRMEHACRIEQRDEYSFRLSIDGDRPYFSGALGRFLIEALRPSGRLREGQQIAGEFFDVTVVKQDSLGVRELEFRFHQPLTSERFCFYVGTPGCAAARVRFAPASNAPEATQPAWAANPPSLEEIQAAAVRLRAGDARAADVVFRAADGGEGPVKAEAGRLLGEICQPVAEALASPVLKVTGSGVALWSDYREVACWWSRHVDDTALQVLSRSREEFAEMRWKRDALFRIRQIAATIIQADLYLTGPPFPGPR